MESINMPKKLENAQNICSSTTRSTYAEVRKTWFVTKSIGCKLQ